MVGAVGDVATLEIVFTNTVNADEWVNTLHFERLDTAQTFEDLADEFEITVLDDWLHPCSNVAHVDLLRVRDAVPGTGAGVDHGVSPSQVGDVVGASLPFQDCAVITWRTALAGRSYRGRSYIPAMPEARSDNGILDGTAMTELNALANALFAQYGPSGTSIHWRLGILSRQLNGAPRATPVITPVASFTVRPTIFTQRRRQPGRGS